MQRRHLSLLSTFALVAGIALGALSLPCVASAQGSGTKVGVAAVVRGTVQAQAPGTTAQRPIRSGDAIYLGDTITTGANSNLQILLLDETVFTVGFQSNVVIDEFVYDPASKDGKVDVRMNQGTFRFTTGQIARKNPEQLKVKLPVATIGVRGTGVLGQTDSQSASVMLAERGDQNDFGLPPSAITLSNDQGSEEIADAGFGSDVPAPGAAPTPPTPWDDQKIAGILNSLDGGGPPGGGNLPSTDDAGISGAIGTLPNPEDVLDREFENNSQDALDDHLEHFDPCSGQNWDPYLCG